MTKLLTVDDVAKRVGTYIEFIYRQIASGTLEASDISTTPGSGRPRWRITEKSLENWLRARSNRARGGTPARRKRRQSKGEVIEFV